MRTTLLAVLSTALVASAASCSNQFTDGSGGGAGTGTGAGAPSDLPCDVDAVLQEHCQLCHTNPPRYGAPMPLVSWADTQAPAVSSPSAKVADLMKIRVHDEDAPMPPSADLGDADTKVLDDWFAAGTPKGTEGTCGGAGGGGASPPIGPEALPCKATATFTAHAAEGAAPYHVPDDAGNLYECFTFKSPWNGTTQGTAWAPIVGDERVLHHWILYKTSTPQVDGGVGPCEMPSDATFVAGWAPGGTNYVLPSDVGLELAGPDDSLILQVHYHNLEGFTDADDASGVALCTTDEPREHAAGIYTLGAVNIAIPPHANDYSVSGTCPSWATSFLAEPLTIIATFPHMHGLGKSIRTDIRRGSATGPLENLVDVSHFSFDDQRFYESQPPVVFNPGDEATTTCVYDNPGDSTVYFGEKTEDEMCFDFVLLYPITLFTGDLLCGLL